MNEKKGLPIFLLVLKITAASVMALTLIIFMIGAFDALSESTSLPENPPSGTVQLDPVPVYIALALVLSLIPMIPCFVLSLLGFIISVFYRSSPKKKQNRIIFFLLSLFPFLYYGIVIITGVILGAVVLS